MTCKQNLSFNGNFIFFSKIRRFIPNCKGKGKLVAGPRFELGSGDPKSPMLDRYTTRLYFLTIFIVFFPCSSIFAFFKFISTFSSRKEKKIYFMMTCFSFIYTLNTFFPSEITRTNFPDACRPMNFLK